MPETGDKASTYLSELRRLLERRTGMCLEEDRLAACIAEYAAARRCDTAELLSLARSSAPEFESLLESVLRQEDSFFALPEITETVENQILPELRMRKFWESPRSLQIWCASCGAGDEAYSLAMAACRALDLAEDWRIQVLATEVSHRQLEHAARGVYPASQLERVAPADLARFFIPIGDHFMVRPKLRDMVSFVHRSLSQADYVGLFDVIVCSRSLGHYSPEMRAAIIRRFRDSLNPGGYLLLSQAGAISGCDSLQPLGVESSMLHKPERPNARLAGGRTFSRGAQ
jgi:chemotaxis methyl-accepting protein methylase